MFDNTHRRFVTHVLTITAGNVSTDKQIETYYSISDEIYKFFILIEMVASPENTAVRFLLSSLEKNNLENFIVEMKLTGVDIKTKDEVYGKS